MPARYHPALVTLHWLIAILLLMALTAGALVIDDMPNTDPAKQTALLIHAIMGVTIGALMLIRLVVRLMTRHPAPARSGLALADRLAPVAHWALYALVLGMVASGLGLSVSSGLGNALFGDAPMPAEYDIYAARIAHGGIATLLILTIGLHVLAALWHIVVRRDGLLRRMGYGRGNA